MAPNEYTLHKHIEKHVSMIHPQGGLEATRLREVLNLDKVRSTFNFVEEQLVGSSVIDLGGASGFLASYLLLRDKIDSARVIDVDPSLISSGRVFSEKLGISDRLSCELGNICNPRSGSADTVLSIDSIWGGVRCHPSHGVVDHLSSRVLENARNLAEKRLIIRRGFVRPFPEFEPIVREDLKLAGFNVVSLNLEVISHICAYNIVAEPI
jgi:hypothetical protein